MGRHLKAAEHGGHEVVNRLGVEASMNKKRGGPGLLVSDPVSGGRKTGLQRSVSVAGVVF